MSPVSPTTLPSMRLSYSHILLLCCLLLVLSACSSATGSPAITRVTATPSAVGRPATPKPSERVMPNEAILRKQLGKAQQIIRGMSLEQKLGQLIIVEYLGTSYTASGLQEMIAQQYVGGFMYQASNHNFEAPYNTVESVKALSAQTMKDARIPLLIATDQEGGLVNRLSAFHGYLPSAQQMADSGDPHTALTQGTQAAKWLLDLGINSDLAPVVDVHTVDPPILETRMFGRNPKTVATYAGAFLAGLQNNGVAGCLKHFPGLGAITSDPHAGLPTVTRTSSELNAIDLAPYKTLIPRDQPAMIMSTDVLMPAIDPQLPAELSPKAINGVLRKQLGYDGVVITDGLYMAGISARWSLSQAAVLSVIAGNDLIEGPFTPGQVASVVTALKQALQQGKISVGRIDQSVQRILLMKMHYGIIK
jgi:beta-N-acetylhexosaminidase